MTPREARRAAEQQIAAERETERLHNLATHAADALATEFVATRRLQPKGYVCITEIEMSELSRLADTWEPRGTLADGRRWSVDPRRWSSCRLIVKGAPE